MSETAVVLAAKILGYGSIDEPVPDDVMDAAADIEAYAAQFARDTKPPFDAARSYPTDEALTLAAIDALVNAASDAREAVDSLWCPSVWKTGEPQPHDARCIRLRAALEPFSIVEEG